MFQTIILVSLEPLNIIFGPNRDKVFTQPLCSISVFIKLKEVKLHSFIVVSHEPLTNIWLLGKASNDITGLKWPYKVEIKLLLFQILILKSFDDVAIKLLTNKIE